jgi:hypothetical protein
MAPPPKTTTTPESTEKYFGKFHQFQGATTHCADYSISMACNIFYDRKGRSTSRCKVDKITKFLDRYFFLGYRFPAREGITEGGATPGGIMAALLLLGIPFSFNPFGTMNTLEHALIDNKMVIVSQGQIMDPTSGTWGHVMLLVGMDGDVWLLLDPSRPAGSGVSRMDKRAFLKNWWYPPFHPCWVIG